ncbi:MAG: YaaR family protein [Spirochaetaceae bacterium]|jgi:uncharacterized protein YaaR (DUF327 family)|nr:YaaR family protein [Spirochaetaceae bacterium]
MAEVDALAGIQYSAAILGQTRQAQEQKRTWASKKNTFRSILDRESRRDPGFEAMPEIDRLADDDALVVLKDALDMAGDALKKNLVTENFAAYRRSVKHFVQFVVERAYLSDTVKKPYKRQGWKYPQDTIIRVVDEKLDQLAAEVLSNHGDRLAILARVDEINGLLIDLLS